MNTLTQKELEQIFSLYLDGELGAEETRRLEEFLATHPAMARELEILRTAQRSLTSKEKLPPNDWFWLKLSNTLETNSRRPHPFSLRSRPALALSTLATVMVLAMGLVYFKDAPLFHRFFLDKKMQAEELYRNNIMTGNILPLFSNLNKDDVLNFALFGSIAVDSASNTSLQVKNTEDRGSQIQIVRNESVPAPPLTVKDFAAEIGITGDQQEVVDSILGTYKEKLQASVLVSENDEVAIHAELAQLNRAMVSTIAACLEPPQRTRFQKFLDVRKAPFAVVAVNAPQLEGKAILAKIPKISTSNNYVVISPAAVEVAEMRINVDSIRDVARRQEMTHRRMVTERMVVELADRHRRLEENIVTAGQNRVRVESSAGAFQIHFEHRAPSAVPGFEMVEMVKPRVIAPRPSANHVTVIGDSAVMFEIPADDRTVGVFKKLPRGEFQYEIVDSVVAPKMKLLYKSPAKRREAESRFYDRRPKAEEELIDLDSLLRESERTTPAPAPAKPKRPGKEVEIETVM